MKSHIQKTYSDTKDVGRSFVHHTTMYVAGKMPQLVVTLSVSKHFTTPRYFPRLSLVARTTWLGWKHLSFVKFDWKRQCSIFLECWQETEDENLGTSANWVSPAGKVWVKNWPSVKSIIFILSPWNLFKIIAS